MSSMCLCFLITVSYECTVCGFEFHFCTLLHMNSNVWSLMQNGQREKEGSMQQRKYVWNQWLFSPLYSGCGKRLLPVIIFRQGWSFNPGLAQHTTKTPQYSFNLFCLQLSHSVSLREADVLMESSIAIKHLLKVHKQHTNLQKWEI